MAKSDLRQQFLNAWKEHGFDGSDITAEHRFHPKRRWRLDIAWPSLKVAVELDGWGYGHQSVGGKEKDNEKANAAAELGWIILRYTPSSLRGASAEGTIEQVCNVLMNQAAATERTV